MNIELLTSEKIEEVKTAMYRIFSAPPWNDQWTDHQLHLYVQELMENNNSLSLGFRKESQLIGISLGRIKHWYEGTDYWIDEFGLLPQYQKLGLGSRFLEEIETFLSERGIFTMTLLTERAVPAYFFYRKNGFTEKEEQVFFSKIIK